MLRDWIHLTSHEVFLAYERGDIDQDTYTEYQSQGPQTWFLCTRQDNKIVAHQTFAGFWGDALSEAGDEYELIESKEALTMLSSGEMIAQPTD